MAISLYIHFPFFVNFPVVQYFWGAFNVAYGANNKLGEPLQSAYRPLHSTETALLRVKNDILRSIDDHKAVALVLLDLSAAFDTVDHTILIQRLEQVFGLEGLVLGWFRSYLYERKQCISIKQAISDAVCLVFGVPQGSVLGPLLFVT